jgi:predicted RNase H-like nuclease
MMMTTIAPNRNVLRHDPLCVSWPVRQAGGMYFIGLDLAWKERNPTGIAIVDINGPPQHLATLITDEAILQVLDPYVSDDCLVAIDAPLLVTNQTAPRPAEAELNRLPAISWASVPATRWIV